MQKLEISGVVNLDGQPISAPIYCISQSGAVYKTASNTLGEYHQKFIGELEPMTVIAVPPEGYRPLAHGPIQPYTSQSLWRSDGNTLEGWTNNGITVDANQGVNPPAFRVWPRNNYAFVAPLGEQPLPDDTVIRFVAKVGAGSSDLMNVFFGCSASGSGGMLRIEGRTQYKSGLAYMNSWSQWDDPHITVDQFLGGQYHEYFIHIKSGSLVDLYIDNQLALKDAPVNMHGGHIGFHGDAGSRGGYIDEIEIF